MTLPVADVGRPGGGGIGRPLGVAGRGGAAGRGAAAGADGAPTRASAGRGACSGRPLEMIGPWLEMVRSLEVGATAGAFAVAVSGGAVTRAGATGAACGVSATAGTGSPAGSAATGAGSGAGSDTTTGSGVATTGVASTTGVSTTGGTSTGATGVGSATTGAVGVSTGATSATAATSGVLACSGGASTEASSVADEEAAAFLVGFVALPGFSGSGGCASRVRPSRTARRRTMSAYASANDDEWLLTGTPSALARSTVSALVMPSSCASSCTRMFFATLRFNLSLCAVSQGRGRSPPAQFVNSCRS